MGSTAVSAIMAANTTKPQGGPGLTGGSIKRLLSQYQDILKVHQAEGVEEEARRSFTQNILQATSNIMELSVGWNEIPASEGRYETTSQIFSSIDLLGYIYNNREEDLKACKDDQQTDFVSNNIKLTIYADDGDMDTNCFAAGDLGSICLPQSDKPATPECTVYVSSEFQVQSENSAMFLPGEESNPSPSALGQNIIGLTVNNASLNTNNAEEPIRVVIKHYPGFQVTPTFVL